MESIGENSKGKSLVRVDSPREAALLDGHLPYLSFSSRRARRELRRTDDINAWPVTVAIGSRALKFAAEQMEARAEGLESQIRTTQFTNPERDPKVELMKSMAAAIHEPQD